MTYNRFLQYFDEGGDVLPPAFKEAYDYLAPAPNTEYGSILPVARDTQTGEKRFALPSALRDAALGATDLAASIPAGELTMRALKTLFGASGVAGSSAPAGALASSGPQVMRSGLNEALQPVLEYLGGLRRNPRPEVTPTFNPLTQSNETHWWQPYVDKGTTYPWKAGESWDMVRANQERFLNAHPDAENLTRNEAQALVDRPLLPRGPRYDDDRAMGAALNYTGPNSSNMSGALRMFAENPNRTAISEKEPYGLPWWRDEKIQKDFLENNYDPGDIRHQKDASYLAKWLQDQEYELPFDAYRSSRMRVPDHTNITSDMAYPQVHGQGFGSFSFDPRSASGFGSRETHFPSSMEPISSRMAKVPFMARIPQGTKVRGANLADHGYSEMSGEKEFLAAPFQGFDVSDVNHLVGYRGNSHSLHLDIEPSGIYDPKSPAIYARGGRIKAIKDALRSVKGMQ